MDNSRFFDGMTSYTPYGLTPVYTDYRAEAYQSGTTTTTGEITEAVTWDNFNNTQEHPTHPDGTISQTGGSGGGWQGWATSDKTWSASDGFTVNIQEHPTTSNGPSDYYDSNMIGITDEWTTIPGGSSPAWNAGYKHQGASGNNEFVFFSESPDQRRITCGGTQNNYDSSGNIGADHEMKIEVLPSGTVNFYWDGSTTALHTCSGASGDYRVYFGGYDGNSSGGYETTVTYEGDITTPVYSYRNFADLGFTQNTERFVGQEFGSGSSSGVEENTNANDVSHFEQQVGAGHMIGQQITAGNSLIGKTITGLTFNLYKLSNGASNCDTETFTFGVWDNNSPPVLQHSFGDLVCSTVTNTGTAHTDGLPYSQDTGSHVLAENEVLAMRANENPNNQYTLEVVTRDSDVYANGQRVLAGGSSSNTWGGPARDMWFQASYDVTNYADLVGQSIDNVQLRLEKIGSPTGTAEVGVWDSSNTKVHSFGNYDMSSATVKPDTTNPSFDFSSGSGWTSTNTNYVDVIGGELVITSSTNNIAENMVYDLSSDYPSGISDTWVMTWKNDITSYAPNTNSGHQHRAYVCVTSGTAIGEPASVDEVCVGMPPRSDIQKYEAVRIDNSGSSFNPYYHYQQTNTNLDVHTKWLKLERNGTTDATLSIYSTSDITGIPDDTATVTGLTSIAQAQYIKASQFTQSNSGTLVVEIDDMKFCNGTTDMSTCIGSDSKDISFTSSTPYTIQANDKLGMLMDATGSDDDNFVQMYYGKAVTETNETLTSSTGTTDWNFDNSASCITDNSPKIDMTQGSCNDNRSASLDLGTLGDTWTVRGLTEWSGSQSGNPIFWVGVSDQEHICAGSGGCDVGYYNDVTGMFLMHYSGSDYKGSFKTADKMDSGGDQTNLSPTTTSSTTDYYFEIKREGSSGTVSIFPDDTFGTATATYTSSEIGEGYQYLNVVTYKQGGGRSGSLSEVSLPSIDTDYNSSLSKLKYGTFGSLEDGFDAIQEQSQTNTNLDLDGTSTSGWTNSDGILSSSNGELVITDSGTNHKAHYDFTETNGDFTWTYKVEFVSGGDGGGIGLHDGSDSSWSNWSGSYAQFMGVYFANGGWMYAGAHTGGSWNSPSNDLCSNSAYSSGSTQQLSSGDERWVTVDKTATQFVVKVYTDSARQNLVCEDTRAFTDGGASMTGFDRLSAFTKWQSQSHDYRFDDILIQATTITQPYVPAITYDLRFQSTLGNSVSGAGLDFDGTDDYVQLDGKFDFLHKEDGSISFWINPDSVNNNELIVNSMANSAANGAGIDITSKGTGSGLRVNLINSANQWNTNLNTPDPLTIGQWQHIVVTTKTVDGTQTAKIYVDGVLKDTEEYVPATANAGGDMRIGKHATDPNSYAYFDGKLDEFTIWNYELDYFAIETIYNQGDGRDPSTLQAFIQNNVKPVVYYNFDDSGATNQYPPLTDVPNICEDITGNQCTVNNIPIVKSWTCYNCAQGSMTTVGDSSIGSVKAGNKFVGDSEIIGTNPTTVTYSLWLRQGSGNANTVQMEIVNSAGVVQETCDTGVATSSLPLGSTHHNVSCTFSGTHTIADGDRIVVPYSWGDANTALYMERGYCGQCSSAESTNYVFNQYSVYDGSSWNDQTAYHHYTQIQTDTTSHSELHDGTISQATSTAGVIGTAMDFDGSSHIEIADHSNLDGTGGFSVSLWTNTDNFTDKRLFGKGSNSGYELLSETTNDKPRWRINDGSTTTIEGATALSDGTWYNLIAVYDPTNSEMRLYVNGVLDATGAIGANINTNSDPLYIGRNASGNNFDGQIDEFYYFAGKAITGSEALAIYQAGLAGNQLSSSITTTSGAGTYLIDSSGIHDAVYGINSATYTGTDTVVWTWDGTNDTDWVHHDLSNPPNHEVRLESPDGWYSIGGQGSSYGNSNDDRWSYDLGAKGIDMSGDFKINYKFKTTSTQDEMFLGLYEVEDEYWYSSGQTGGSIDTWQSNGNQVSFGSYQNSWTCNETGSWLPTTNTWYYGQISSSGNDMYFKVWGDDWEGSTSHVSIGSGTGGYNSGDTDRSGCSLTDVDLKYIIIQNQWGGSRYVDDISVYAPATVSVSPTFETGKLGTKALVSPQLSFISKPLITQEDVTISSNAFSPTPLSITTGSTVTWSNNDNTIHQVVGTDNTVIGNAPNVDVDDFSTDKGWVTSDSNKVNVDSGKLKYDIAMDSTYDGASYDLGSALDSSSWILRFKWDIDALSSGSSNGSQGYIGMSDKEHWTSSSHSADIAGISFVQQHNSVGDMVINASDDNNDPMNFGGSGSSGRQMSVSLQSGTSYYVEIKRDGNDFTTSVSSSNSYSGDLASNTQTESSTTDLQYIWVQAQKDSSGSTLETDIDEIQICDGNSNWSNCSATAIPISISAGGGTHSETFTEAGTYNYECPIHSGMTGQIVVADSYSMPSGTEDFTVSSWIKTTQAPATVTTNESFDSYTTQTQADTAWVSEDTNYHQVDISTDKLEFDYTGYSNSSDPMTIVHDIGYTLDPDDWILRYKLDITGHAGETTGGKSMYLTAMIASSDNSSNENQGNLLKNIYIHDAGGNGLGQAQFQSRTGGAIVGTYYGGMTYTPSVNTIWVEWKNNGGSITSTFYSDEFVTQESGTTPVTLTKSFSDLQYFQVMFRQDSGGNGYDVGTIDDLQICNGQNDWANCTSTGTDEIGTVLAFETQEAPVMASTSDITNPDTKIIWDSLTGVTYDSTTGQLTVDGTAPSWTGAVATGQSCTVGTDTCTMQIDIGAVCYGYNNVNCSPQDNMAFGWTDDVSATNGYGDMDYGFYVNPYMQGSQATWEGIEGGSGVAGMSHSLSDNDVGTITVETNGDVVYFINGSNVRTVNGAISSGTVIYPLNALLNAGQTSPQGYWRVVPTDVEVEQPTKTTAFEVEPTAMRIVDIAPDTPSTALQQNFDSDAGWTQTGTLTSITGGELVMNSANGGTPAGIEYDFGSPLSNQFVLQYEYTSPMTWAPAHYAGTMMSCSGDPDACTGDKIGISINGDWSTNGQGGDFSIVDADNSSGAAGSAGYWSGASYVNYNLNTKYFVEFVRNNSDMTLTVWDDSMNGSSQVGTFTETFTGTYTDIQYMSFSNQHNGNNSRDLSYNVDNLKFCDGGTSMSACEAVAGARTNIFETTGLSLTPNDWKHVTWVRDGSSWTSLVDRTQVDTQVSSSSLGTAKATEAGTSSQSISFSPILNNQGLGGSMGNVVTGVSGKIGNAWEWNGSNSQAWTAGSVTEWKFLSDQSAWTFAFWFNDDNSSQNSRFFNTMNDNSGANRGFSLTHDGTGLCLGIYDGTPAAGYPFSSCASGIFNDTGVWHHYTITYDGSGTAIIYKDGIEHTQLTQGRTMSSSDPNHTPYVGYRIDNQRYLDGDMDEMLIWEDFTATPAQVLALATDYTIPSISNLREYYKFEDTSTTMNTEESAEGLVSTPATYPTYFIGTQPDLSLPLAVIDELHVHSSPQTNVANKSYDRGNAQFALVDTVAVSQFGSQMNYQDTSVTAGDSPIYQIASYNLLGETPLMTLVQGLTVQQAVAPTNLAGSANSNAHVVLTWTPSQTSDMGGGSYLGTQVERKQGLLGTWTAVATNSDSGNLGTFTDSTVTISQNYDYRIAYVNEAGVGNYSSDINVTAGTPPSPPVISSVSIPDPDDQPHDHLIQFTAPADMGTGSLQHYALYTSVSNQNNWAVANNNIGTSTSYTYQVTGTLLPSADYFYKIVAVSNHGTSNDSNVLYATTPDVPLATSAPTISIPNPDTTPLQIQIDFTNPSSDGGAVIKGWQIERWDSTGQAYLTINANTGNTNLQYIDSTVSANTQYKYRISSINVMGNSPLSADSNTVTTATTPSIPLTLQTTSISNSQIDMTWGQPSQTGNSAITNYELSYEYPVGSNTWTTLGTVPVTQTNYSFTGLVPDVEYKLGVSAINLIGTGGMATDNEWTRPNAPSNFGVQPIDNASLYVGWDIAGQSTSTFRLQTDFSGTWTDVMTDTYGNLCIGNNSGLCEFVVGGLVSASDYNFRIYNTNDGGESAVSAESNNWTIPNEPANLAIAYSINSATQLTLSFTAPTGTVTGYLIESNDGTGWVTEEPNHQTLSFTKSGLALTSVYEFRVASINLGGTSIYSPIISQTTASPPDPPQNLTLTVKDQNYLNCPTDANSATGYCMLLSWQNPQSTSGANILGFMVEKSSDGINWTTEVLNTQSTGTSILDTGLQKGETAQYRVSAHTVIGTGLPSNDPSKTLVDGTFVVAGQAVGGKTVTVTPQLSITHGTPNSVVDSISLYAETNQPSLDSQTVNAQQITGTTQVYTDFYQYPTATANYLAKIWITQDNAQFLFESNSISVTPTTSYSGNVLLTENRNQTATGYSESTFDLSAIEANWDAVLVYQHADPTVAKEYHLYENIQANVTDAITVQPNSDYYISVYLNPTEFDYATTGSGTAVTLSCNDDSPANCEDGKIPPGTRSDYVVRSLKHPDSQPQLGIEGLGGLFGLPMIFVFIIGLSAVFTTRSSHMGILFIVIAIGLMSYLGYLSFDIESTTNLDENSATWGIIIVVTIVGLFIGKRWS
ncbi:fibronectin type III domain-containing protein [Candidatus Nitrosopelagicus sp.]|nr:fibronectin type III domain-containing protein [Candidatus Nitrosopelagicus sp.]